MPTDLRLRSGSNFSCSCREGSRELLRLESRTLDFTVNLKLARPPGTLGYV